MTDQYILNITCLQCKKEYSLEVLNGGRVLSSMACPSCKFCGNVCYDSDKNNLQLAPEGSYGCELCDSRCEPLSELLGYY
mgnify:CR=1 FL=1